MLSSDFRLSSFALLICRKSSAHSLLTCLRFRLSTFLLNSQFIFEGDFCSSSDRFCCGCCCCCWSVFEVAVVVVVVSLSDGIGCCASSMLAPILLTFWLPSHSSPLLVAPPDSATSPIALLSLAIVVPIVAEDVTLALSSSSLFSKNYWKEFNDVDFVFFFLSFH